MATEDDLPASAVRLYERTEIDGDQNGLYAIACWMVPYRDTYKFLQGAFMTAIRIGGPTGPITRVVPLMFPDFPDNLILYAQGFKIKADGVGAVDTLDVKTGLKDMYGVAFIEVEFRTVPWTSTGDNPYQTVRTRTSGRQFSLPASAIVLGSTMVDHPIGDQSYTVPGMTIDITTYQVPEQNVALWASVSRCVNDDSFAGFDAGTLLYLGANTDRQTTVAGQTVYQITHSFEWSSLDWNIQPSPGGFPAIYVFADGTPLYPSISFDQLFS